MKQWQSKTTMKWNMEWLDLQNIERMTAECWRMSGPQLQQLCQDLTERRDLEFAGGLGLKFLEMLCGAADGSVKIEWAKLQKDVRKMLEIIQDGQEQGEDYWKKKYEQLSADTSAFYTQFGSAFYVQIEDKLELNVSEDKKRLLHDIEKIRGICDSCDWKNEAEARRMLSVLTQESHARFFSSWLGKLFVDILRERFGTGEKERKKEPETSVKPQSKKALRKAKKESQKAEKELQKAKKELQKAAKKELQEAKAAAPKTQPKAKIVWTVVICIMIAGLGVYLYMQTHGGWEHFVPQGLIRAFEHMTAGQEADGANGTGSSMQPDKIFAERDEALTNGNVQLGKKRAEQKEDKKAIDPNTADTGVGSGKSADIPKVLAEYRFFYEKYPDLFGWLKIQGTEIDHPVMQADSAKRGEPYFYLHRDYTGKYKEAGSLFVEEKSSVYPQDDNTVIYGHNMSNGHNFGILEQYMEKGFYQSHKTVQYDTIYEKGTYQIAAVLTSRILYQDEKGFRYYQFYNYNTDSEFQECVDFIKENQLYETGVKLEYGDRLLMLSTCEYSRENGRLVVVAKRL